LYDQLPSAIDQYVFSDACPTPILKAKHSDSSGVRGAAWLWR
jgi:fructokinase